MDDQKLSQYTQGTVRKSKREKEKEREEAKRREEEELAAKTYAEFLDEFEGDNQKKAMGSGFVRAGASTAQSGSGMQKESVYKPSMHSGRGLSERGDRKVRRLLLVIFSSPFFLS